MIKKISVFALLFSFLLALGVPVRANAAMSSTDLFNDWCLKNGLPLEFGYESVSMPYVNYVVGFEPDNNNCFFVIRIFSEGDVYLFSDSNYTYIKGDNHCFDFTWSRTTSTVWDTFSRNNHVSNSNRLASGSGNLVGKEIVFSTINVYTDSSCTEILFEKVKPPYTFDTWCSDAGLTCAASSNESDSVIPFWYEPDNYNYIVRKTLTASSTSGVYQMTMLQKTDGAHYPYYFEVNDIGYLGVAGAFSDISTFTVRSFYYDAEGNGWKYIERFDVSTLPFDNTNVTFDENVVFIYSDTHIYADREASSIWQAASTEYYNVDIPEPDVPTPTPTSVPVSGGTTVGGNAKPGGLLEFFVTLVTLVWTDLFAVEVPVDGYSISFQAIVIWGAIAGLLIFGGCKLFGKKG